VRPEPGTIADAEALADELVTRARQTGAKITFVEDARLLQDVGGVGALLRYRVAPETAAPPPVPPEGVGP
jgi:peptide subunit release factor 1 (eRF1)